MLATYSDGSSMMRAGDIHTAPELISAPTAARKPSMASLPLTNSGAMPSKFITSAIDNNIPDQFLRSDDSDKCEITVSAMATSDSITCTCRDKNSMEQQSFVSYASWE